LKVDILTRELMAMISPPIKVPEALLLPINKGAK